LCPEIEELEMGLYDIVAFPISERDKSWSNGADEGISEMENSRN
jgi:hypothetical protein